MFGNTNKELKKAFEQPIAISPAYAVLLDCPCGQPALDVDWTGATEYGGKTYQTCWVTCTSCDTDVSINVNTDLENDSKLYEQIVFDAWNKLTRAI
jgi:hypothetical protein